jgi:hypothetical protein
VAPWKRIKKLAELHVVLEGSKRRRKLRMMRAGPKMRRGESAEGDKRKQTRHGDKRKERLAEPRDASRRLLRRENAKLQKRKRQNAPKGGDCDALKGTLLLMAPMNLNA